MFVGFLLTTISLVISLMLIYAIPFERKVAKPYASAIAYLGTVIYTCLIINVASKYVSTRPQKTEEIPS